MKISGKTEEPVFSIITVTKNCSSKLKTTLDSVRKQEFEDFEIIIKDALSTDDTLSYVPEDARVRVIRAADSGIYSAMNDAYAYVRGRYVLFLNAGDYLLDSYVLGKVYQRVVENPGAILYGDFYHSRYKQFYRQDKRLSRLYFYYGTLNHQTVFFPVDLLKRSPLYHTCYRIAGDYELIMNLFTEGADFEYLGFGVSYYDSGVSGSEEGIEIRIKEYQEIQRVYYSAFERGIFGLYAQTRKLVNRWKAAWSRCTEH